MPRKAPTNGVKFKPGQSGNPGGRPKLPEDIREARKMNQLELERIVNKYLYTTVDAVDAALKDPATPMMERMVAMVVSKAAEVGDHTRLDFILSRLIGRVKDQIEITTVKPYIIHNINGGQTVLGAKVENKDEENHVGSLISGRDE